MNEKLQCRVNSELKNNYTDFITEKFGHKQNRYGKSIEKLMKLELTLEGNNKYCDDPDVLELIDKVREKLLHSHSSIDNGDITSLSKDEILKLKKFLKSSESEVETPIRDSSMDMFAHIFKETYKNNLQVSRREIAMLATLKQGIVDQRAIQNRISYLIAHNILEPFAPNVFNVKI